MYVGKLAIQLQCSTPMLDGLYGHTAALRRERGLEKANGTGSSYTVAVASVVGPLLLRTSKSSGSV